MRKLRKVVPFGLAVMMSLQGIYPAVPVMADTVKVAAAKKTTSSATVLNKKERAKIMQQINAMSPEEGLKLAKKKGIIKEDANTKESNLKKATVNKDAKEGEVGYQFTQDQYVDETHRIRYEYIITAEGEVSADYVNGVIYENGSPKVNYLDEVQTYEINDELTYPSEVTLNGTTYQVKSALFHNTTAKHVIVPEGVESCMGCSSATDMETLTIPSTLKKIGSGFRSCPSSHNYYDSGFLDTRNNATFKGYEMTNPEKAKYLTVKDGIVYNKEETEMLTKVPCALEKDTLVLPDTIKEIPEGAFMSNKTIKKVVFGKNITSIGNGAFAYSNIENVQMNDNVTALDEYAFYYCTKLANVDLSKSLTKIDGYETFKYTAALKHIDLKNVTELTGWYTFQQSGLEDVDLSNVESVDGVQVFGLCHDLKTVYIGKNTDFSSGLMIGCACFVGCFKLEKYVQKEKNIHNLYVEDGKLYAKKMSGYVALPDGDMEVKTLKGKILLGYPTQMQKKNAEDNNGVLKIDDDVTAIGGDGLTAYAQYIDSEGHSTAIEELYHKLILPAAVESFSIVYSMPKQDLEVDIYGNTLPALSNRCIYSVGDSDAGKEDATLGTKTIKFKTAALKEEFEQHWKEHVMYIYQGEKEVYDVLPEKKTTSLSLNKTSDKILCDGTSHEIHLIAKLSEDDCTDVVTFKSSNEDLATVDGNGVVTTKANAHGTATITATAGDHTATYKLTQAGSGIDVTADQKTIVYKEWWETENLLDNIKKSIDVTCADCHNNLRRDKDYEVIVSDYKKTGKVDVTIKGIGAFEGMTAKTSVNVEYHKHGEEGYDIRNLYSGYNWTGKEVKPDVIIRCADCNKELKEGTDYKLEYKNNVNVGTATVKVVGMGAYEGVDQTANFEIEEDCGWNGIKYYNDTYQNGDHIGSLEWSEWGYNKKTPYIPIACNHCGKELENGKDYTITFSNTDHPGEGTAKVVGLNEYAGYELSFTYTLKAKDLRAESYYNGDDLGTYKWTGKEVKPDIGKIYVQDIYGSVVDTEAVEGKDYQLEYSNNIEEGTATVKVVGIGDAKGTVLTYTYHIEKQHGWNGFSVTGHKDGDDLGSYEWTGNEVEPELNLTCNHCGNELYLGRDYELEYTGDRTEPGKVTVKVIGTGDYEGWTQSYTYTIMNKTFSFESYQDGEDLGAVEYTGSEVRYPISNVTDKTGKTLSEGTDYKLVYSDNTKPGVANVQIIGLNDYDGCTLSFTYTIVDHDGESGFHNNLYTDGADMGSYAYTGEEVKPSIGLMYSNYNQTFLIEGVDYKIEYSNNINPGVATAKVIGIGRYAGHEMSFTYTISNKTFSFEGHKDGENLGTVEYTGKEVKYPISSVTDKIGKTLSEGSDYKLVYSNNVNVGTASVQIVGLGDYEGCTLSFTYKITNMDGESGFSSNTYIDGSSLGSFTYTGEEVKPSVGMIYSHYNHTFLIEGTDYKVEYSNNVNPGVAKAKVVGIGRYAGHELNFTYTIRNKNFSSKKYENESSLGTVKWTGKAVTVDIGEMIDETDGHVLTEGTDYKVTYSNNINVGKATVKVTGLGYYEGKSLRFYYTIKKQCGWNGFYAKDHSDGDSLGVFDWTGNSILIDPDMRCKHCGKELQENKDYTVEYENNMDPGVAKMKIIGMGDFEGYELNFTFRIRKKTPSTTGDQKPTTTTTETKPTTGTTESSSATSETKPTTGTTESTTTTTTEDKTTTTTETKTGTTETTSTEQPTTAIKQKKLTSVSGSKDTTYTGKAIKWKLSVKSGNNTLKENRDYKVAYSNNVNCGIATVKITGIGDYQGTITKTFKIAPKKAVIHAAKAAKKVETVEIRKSDGGVSGYQISYSYKKNFKGQKVKDLKKFKYKKIKVKRKKYTIVSYKIKGLKRKKTAYIRVRAYKQVGKTKVYGKWSSVKKVKIK